MTKKNPSKKEKEAVKKQTKKKVPTKRIPLADVIHVDIDDEVGSIFDRIKKKRAETVYLIVPKRSVVFQSIINVKILKRKAKDIDKNIAFITKDKSGIYFANKSGLKVYDGVSESKKLLQAKDLTEPLTEILSDSNFGFIKGRPTKNVNNKVSISHITEGKLQESFTSKLKRSYKELFSKKKKRKKRYFSRSPLYRPLFASLLAGSLFLLFAVVYLTLPHATIVLKPNLVPINERVRVTLLDAEQHAEQLENAEARQVPSFKIEPGTLSKTVDFQATGADPDTPRSSGTITILNKEPDSIALVPNTRFVTEKGLVFRTKNYVAMHGGNEIAPSTAVVEVYAAEADIDGHVIGAKGNIKDGTELYVLNFEEDRRPTFYALANGDFSGGINSEIRVVTEGDIQAAKDYATKQLLDDISILLSEKVKQRNKEKGSDLIFLDDRKAIQLGEVIIEVDESIVGQKVDSFKVTAKIKASGIAFDKQEFIELLIAKIEQRQGEDKSLTQVDEESISYNVVEVDFEDARVEVDANIVGVERYNLSLDHQLGVNIDKKIREHIVGLSVADAKLYIENLPQVETVEINTWPFWAPTVPKSAKNIKVEVNDKQ